jgi:hypothetical protein
MSEIRIEYFSEPIPERPRAAPLFLARLDSLIEELDLWETVIFDSITHMELAFRYHQQYVLNPDTRDPRQWYAGVTRELEKVLQSRIAYWHVNAVIVCHTEENKDEALGVLGKNPSLPGKLRLRAAGSYAEFYRAYADMFGDESVFKLQTRPGRGYHASSQIGAPNPCEPHFDALWANWPAGTPRPPLHVLVHSEPGTGKSTFAATFPKPMLVLLWDPPGKEIPYLRGGEVGDLVPGDDVTPPHRIVRVP